MKTLKHYDDWAIMECSNGHQFEVDPHTEQNLYFDGRCLREVCPECGEKTVIEYKDTIEEHRENLKASVVKKKITVQEYCNKFIPKDRHSRLIAYGDGPYGDGLRIDVEQWIRETFHEPEPWIKKLESL